MANKYECNVTLGQYRDRVIADNRRQAERGSEASAEDAIEQEIENTGRVPADIRPSVSCELVEENTDDEPGEFWENRGGAHIMR